MRNLILLSVLLLPATALAQRDLKDIPDPDPEVERRSFLVADGFEVNLFAADPLLSKPIQMNFDARGRLWVASSEVYPQIEPGQPATDKILILEDKDGDGRADTTSVFADGLLIPTGVEPGDGGAYVANSTELLFLKDTDGDGKADSRTVMLSGFGTEDTHHILHTLRWGEDGLLYFNQSIYIHSHIETPWGPRTLNGGGIWQFRPESRQLKVFAHGWVNPWGHHEDAWGASFATDGAGGEGINYVVPGAYYTTAPDAVRILPGLNPGSPKYCGLEVLSGRHLPDDWQGNLITNDFRANRVCRFVLSDDGSAFAAREQTELLKTTHGAFRPIDVKMGPDGAIYVADWYNPIIQHGEVDFRDPRRDHTRGRIWRITAKDRPRVERPKLVGASIESLLDALKSPEEWTRHFAKRVLKERGANEVRPKLAEWVNALDPTSPGFEHDRLEALWTYQSLDAPEPDLLASVLASPDARARAAACRVVPHWTAGLGDPLALLAPLADDENPRVRLEAVRALAGLDDPSAVTASLRALDRPIDKFLDYALWLTCRETQARWLPLLQAGKLNFGGDARKLTFALSATGSGEVVGPLLASLREGRIAEADRGATIRLIAAVGDASALGSLLDMALTNTTDAVEKRAILDGIADASRSRKMTPTGDAGRLGDLLDSEDENVRTAATRAVGALHLERLRDRLDLRHPERASEFAAALETLSELGGPESLEALDGFARALPVPQRTSAIIALAALDPGRAAAHALRTLSIVNGPDVLGAAQAHALVAGLLGRKGGSAALAEETARLGAGDLPTDAAKLAIRAARASGRDESALIAALARAGNVPAGPVALTEAEMRATVADVLAQGDPARGESVFRRAEMQCLNCHAIAGAGGQVGPGLESIGASAPVDYLVDSLLQPGKAVKEGYHAATVATDDGRVVTGIKLRDNDREIALRDADGREIVLPANTVEEKRDAGSLMPVGLTETLTRGEFLGLVRFLSELGKVGPFAVGKDRVVRRWEVLRDDPDAARKVLYLRGGFGGDKLARAGFAWQPAYSTVAGVLPRADIPAQTHMASPGQPSSRIVRCRIEVTTGGKVGIRHNASKVPGPVRHALWIDDGPDTPFVEQEVDLAPGIHTLTFLLRDAEGPPLRVELFDLVGSPAKARPVVGR